jgi:hypothetical protein
MPCKSHPEVLEGLVTCARCAETFCRDCVIELKGSPYCAVCKEEQVKDVQSGADNSLLNLASIGRRLGALIIDGLILGIPLVVFTVFITLSSVKSGGMVDNDSTMGLQLLIQIGYLVVGVLYEGMLLMSRGQTLGKMALRIKVVTPEGRDISGGPDEHGALPGARRLPLRVLQGENHASRPDRQDTRHQLEVTADARSRATTQECLRRAGLSRLPAPPAGRARGLRAADLPLLQGTV